MKPILIKNIQIVNEGRITHGDVFIKDGRIDRIESEISGVSAGKEIDGTDKYLFPGVIDDQVHFREPGLTHKAEIYTEARAAVAGGTTSFMEMPNTKPPALTQELLEEKYAIARDRSPANYSFFMGVSNDNYDEVMKTNPRNICGIKMFLGSSTGNMLVDDERAIERLFTNSPLLIATHCEDEQTIEANLREFKSKYNDKIPVEMHPIIRSVEACYKSSEFAVGMAKKHDTRLHVLHISTEEELKLFENVKPLKEKRITTEVCVHHLWFDSEDYKVCGSMIKCNPAVKEPRHKEALFAALLENKLDVIATDHAPHTLEEKHRDYLNSPSGIPLVQHSLSMMLEFYNRRKITLEKIVEKMSHAPAECFKIKNRGFIREGYWADLAIVDLHTPWKVEKKNIHYKCGWSPLENKIFNSIVTHTFVSGNLAYQNVDDKEIFDESAKGMRLEFGR